MNDLRGTLIGKLFLSKNLLKSLSTSTLGGNVERTSICSMGLTWLKSRLDPSTIGEKTGGALYSLSSPCP